MASSMASSMAWDYISFVAFIVVSTALPLWNKCSGSGKTQTKASYVFATGSSVSTAAMMLSIARGTLGVRSVLGYPSELYYRGSDMWETLYGMVCAYPIVCFIFLPVYYSLGITSVYQYLDMRFKSRLVRCLASGTYVVRSLLNLGVTVFTPCVALKTVIGLPYWASIVSISAISVFFTLLGGLKAAIHADVIQGVTMIALSLAIVGRGVSMAGGVSKVLQVNARDGRLRFFNWDLDPTVRVSTVSALVGQLFMSLSIFGCQQSFVQRYVSMTSQRAVVRTLMCNIPVIAVLFSLSWVAGMSIYAAYADCDPLRAGYIHKMDEIVPFFVEDAFAFVPGLLGLFMAALFNGALSLAVSIINSLSTVTWEDFCLQIPYFQVFNDKRQLIVIKIIGAVYGVLVVGVAFGVALFSGVIESSMLMTSATSGPLLGVFLLAMLFPCANWKGAAGGMVLAHTLTLWLTFGRLTLRVGDGASGEQPLLPLRAPLVACSNASFTAHFGPPPPPPLTTLDPVNLLDPLDPADVISVTKEPEDFLTELYSITYMYYSLFGCFITVLLGVIISLFTGTCEEDAYDQKLIHPLALRVSRFFPGPPRKYVEEKVVNSTVNHVPNHTAPECFTPRMEKKSPI